MDLISKTPLKYNQSILIADLRVPHDKVRDLSTWLASHSFMHEISAYDSSNKSYRKVSVRCSESDLLHILLSSG